VTASTVASVQSCASYHEYKLEQEKLHQAWLQRKKVREEKLARGEKVGPEEQDPTAEEEVGLLGLLKFIVYLLLIIILAGKFFTGSFLWEYDGKWAKLKTYWPVNALRFSERCRYILTWLWYRNPVAVYFRNLSSRPLTARIQASRYTSRWVSPSVSHQWRLIGEVTAVKIDGDVYDVSSNRRTYGPGGSYHTMYVPSYSIIPRCCN